MRVDSVILIFTIDALPGDCVAFHMLGPKGRDGYLMKIGPRPYGPRHGISGKAEDARDTEVRVKDLHCALDIEEAAEDFLETVTKLKSWVIADLVCRLQKNNIWNVEFRLRHAQSLNRDQLKKLLV